MDATGFETIVQNFTDLTDSEYAQIQQLSSQYPYSQVLHMLLTRGARDLQQKDQEQILHQSAVYATDRQVLKWVMTTPKTVRQGASTLPAVAMISSAAKPEPQAVEPEPVVVEVENVKTVPVQEPSMKPDAVTEFHHANPLSGDALRTDIYVQLEKLQKLKHEFEISFDEFQSAGGKEFTNIVGTTSRENAETPSEPLIEEIKASRKKVKIEGPKQKEQIEIIDQFIKSKPTIARPKPGVDATDLSEDTTSFNDNVVSETLVDILVKQGKKEKAVEVLKKLIWKFPQKKAYFAAQIDKLKS